MFEILKLDSNALIPTQGSDYAAGWDLYLVESTVIPAYSTVRLNLGIALSLEPGYVGLIKDHSGLAMRGASVRGGVIDSDYRFINK